MRNNDPLRRKRLPGCKVCVLELKWRTKVEASSFEIRADIFSCRKKYAIPVNVNFTDSLQYLFSKIPSLSEMPRIATVRQVLQQMIERIQR